MKSNILLESGTGELEIVEFLIGEKHYAINVIKIKEIINISSDKLTKLPESHKAIAGVILNRKEILTVVDLKYVIEGKKSDQFSKLIVCEFNKIKVAFIIDNVIRVQRIKWEEILKPDDISTNSLVVGNIIMNDTIILMLDFEKIITDINPSTGISEERISKVGFKDRSAIKLVIADDSALIRELLRDTLHSAGFSSLTTFDDGKQALNYLNNLVREKGERFTEDVQVLITDIEMPQMDGHTLTRNVKEDPILSRLPVIIFSSLITDDLKHKGLSVKADGQLSKPEVGELVDLIDRLIEKNNLIVKK
ncbi:chemotaxis protein [Clostridium cellulovorans]|uniref:Stage 0 sporulation protein A homolog n=1 Tax=Clostridium cellulovorans (strain ATCC 35296 / DSM 3052 / OCM 3 / 743B) TaxID=573061 RepID=D9SQK2_CLOC7|nr:chemotaxis protein [Clostridium cellulovorans]ADL52208.1 response regulator receiver modulated CheW protein [Clostridium cellulovorans 743B]